ncbi:MAG: hypothetical protein P9M13_11110 [Candidatus Ancaeobacter aquaticus]|nr:hypothetical protein [Candidatus Ancaeobacter aquaticus]
MQMNPKYYYDSFVKPNYDEFCDDEGSIRKAFNAILSLFHMTDNYFNYYKRRGDPRVALFGELKDFQKHMDGITPYFNDVQSMANAYKHLYANSGKAHVTVASGGAVYVEEISENDTSLDNINFGGSVYTVYYLKKDGNSMPVMDALSGMIKAWKNLLQ